LNDVGEDVSISGDFDLETLNDAIGDVDTETLENCSTLGDFIESVCEIGEDCCKKCISQLGYMVDCLINDVLMPYIAGEKNVTVNECPIDAEECELIDERRGLKEGEEEVFAKAMSLPKSIGQTKRESRRTKFVKKAKKNRRLEGETSDDQVATCKATMISDIIATNMSYASDQYTVCVTSAAVGNLEDATEESTSGAAAAFKIGVLVAALVGSFLAL
jgi:hypothetical protein